MFSTKLKKDINYKFTEITESIQRSFRNDGKALHFNKDPEQELGTVFPLRCL